MKIDSVIKELPEEMKDIRTCKINLCVKFFILKSFGSDPYLKITLAVSQGGKKKKTYHCVTFADGAEDEDIGKDKNKIAKCIALY